MTNTNTLGAQINADGYVLCNQCGKPVTAISKETDPQYAYCLEHRPDPSSSQPTTQELSDMPSTTTELKTNKRTKSPKAKANGAKTEKVTAPKIVLKAKATGKVRIPQRGNIATFLKAIEDAGGMTTDQIESKAKSFGLGGKSWMHTCYYARKLGLLKDVKTKTPKAAKEPKVKKAKKEKAKEA